MALTFGMLIPALKYAFDGYEALLAALPLIPAAALAGFSIERLFSFSGTLPKAKYSASAIWWAASQGLFFFADYDAWFRRTTCSSRILVYHLRWRYADFYASSRRSGAARSAVRHN